MRLPADGKTKEVPAEKEAPATAPASISVIVSARSAARFLRPDMRKINDHNACTEFRSRSLRSEPGCDPDGSRANKCGRIAGIGKNGSDSNTRKEAPSAQLLRDRPRRARCCIANIELRRRREGRCRIFATPSGVVAEVSQRTGTRRQVRCGGACRG